ncbi:MAG: NlpC/P60 family protein [Blautia sp.]|nr:NlpC/P60 family protein [Blautia sp.]MDY4516838.1 NlpC/P60 family protein [Lachnospiraceae bacterium]
MDFKRVRKMIGCLAMVGTMVLQTPLTAIAAGNQTSVHKEKEQETKISEADREKQTGSEGETQVGSEEETQTESSQETQVESDSESETETEKTSETDGQTENGTESEQTESTSETTSETEDTRSDADKKIQIVDTNRPDEELKVIEKPEESREIVQEDHSDVNADLTTNIIAGNGIYLDELASVYGLTFEDDFPEVMDEIEQDFCQWLEKPEDFVAGNWQDVLAVYVLRSRMEAASRELTLGRDTKEELEKLFFLMNIRSDSSITKKLSKEVDLEQEICPLYADDYAELKNLGSEEREILEKYTEGECRKLCAIVTASKGFVRGEVGEDVSEERVAIVAAACSLVGKVGYFWGGKSYAIGWDSMWGDPATVTAAGSKSTGSTRRYGLDCSGFVCWSFYNGLGGTDGGIGNHTTTQWNASEMVESGNARPGDLVFYDSPAAGDQNHVGLVIGKNDDGSLLVAHCSSSKNGVVVGEAWSSGFKYVRSPLLFTR